MNRKAELVQLLELSSRVGRNPLLVQASSGNTSIKIDGTLWIKASGKWLAHATDEEILVPINLAALRKSLGSGEPLIAEPSAGMLRPSIETAMHGILEHRVIIHVHSVNAISWAVRLDAQERLAERLKDLPWGWVPYVSSGVPLAKEVAKFADSQSPTTVFILANHGLIVCGDSCEAAEGLLGEVEQRLTVPVRLNRACDHASSPWIDPQSSWELPEPAVHGLGFDAVSRRVMRSGILFPCQAVFLGRKVVSLPEDEFFRGANLFANERECPAFVIIENLGVLTSRTITVSQRAVLYGLLQVVQRLEAAAPIRYLSDEEVQSLLNHDAHQYQLCTESNAPPRNRQGNPAGV